MGDHDLLSSGRLLLRLWRESDREPFAELNADPRVMRHFPHALSRAESDAVADRIQAGFAEYGFGFWAVELPGVAPFIGFVGLQRPRFEAHFTPCVEIGWRLAYDFWGNGYATEAARLAAGFGFETCGLGEIVSFTAVENIASQRVMQKLGMTRKAAEDFDHPSLPEGHRLRRHVLYRLSAEEWRSRQTASSQPAGGISGR